MTARSSPRNFLQLAGNLLLEALETIVHLPLKRAHRSPDFPAESIRPASRLLSKSVRPTSHLLAKLIHRSLLALDSRRESGEHDSQLGDIRLQLGSGDDDVLFRRDILFPVADHVDEFLRLGRFKADRFQSTLLFLSFGA